MQAIASQVQSQAQQVSSQSGAQVLYTTHNAVRGVAVRGDAESIRALASRSDVEKISPILPKYRQNAAPPLTQAPSPPGPAPPTPPARADTPARA